jgi:hypothetical protein
VGLDGWKIQKTDKRKKMKLEVSMFTQRPCKPEWDLYLETGNNVSEHLQWIVEYWNYKDYGSEVLGKVCEIACKQDGWAFEFVPIKLRTPDLCKIACSRRGRALEFVPDNLKTPELCEIACSTNGWALEFVPDNLKTPELCEIACSTNGWALDFVPPELKTPELCKIAQINCAIKLEKLIAITK